MATKDWGPELRWMILAFLAPVAGLILAFFLRKAGGLWQILLTLVGLSPLVYNYFEFSLDLEDLLRITEPGLWGAVTGLLAMGVGGGIDLNQKD